jgi:hypothetical protein
MTRLWHWVLTWWVSHKLEIHIWNRRNVLCSNIHIQQKVPLPKAIYWSSIKFVIKNLFSECNTTPRRLTCIIASSPDVCNFWHVNGWLWDHSLIEIRGLEGGMVIVFQPQSWGKAIVFVMYCGRVTDMNENGSHSLFGRDSHQPLIQLNNQGSLITMICQYGPLGWHYYGRRETYIVLYYIVWTNQHHGIHLSCTARNGHWIIMTLNSISRVTNCICQWHYPERTLRASSSTSITTKTQGIIIIFSIWITKCSNIIYFNGNIVFPY